MSPEPDATISVNFAKPFPLFPLSGLALLPHALIPLHIFEPRYRQMVADAIEDDLPIAMAMFDGDAWKQQYHGRPPIRPNVCLGHIRQHERTPDGRYVILLQGLCRARVLEELPADGDKLYRRALLQPLDIIDPDEELLEPFRKRLVSAMEDDRLADLRESGKFLNYLKSRELPTSVLFDVMGSTYFHDDELRYRLLSSDDAVERAAILSQELFGIQKLLRRAAPQRALETPKGVCWN